MEVLCLDIILLPWCDFLYLDRILLPWWKFCTLTEFYYCDRTFSTLISFLINTVMKHFCTLISFYYRDGAFSSLSKMISKYKKSHYGSKMISRQRMSYQGSKMISKVKNNNHGWWILSQPRRGWKAPPSPNTFSDDKIILFFSLVTQIFYLPHNQGLEVWQYWKPTNREQTNFAL